MDPFDELIDRKGTGSLKWEKYRRKDIIPMWVADMDFRAPSPILTALHNHIDHGVLGYPAPKDDLIEVICSMLKEKYSWAIDPKWIVWLPGLVTGLNLACRSVGIEGDEVLSMVPIYPPFLSAPRIARKKLVTVPLHNDSGKWLFDIRDFEQARTSQSKLLLLCNPQNPTGRVFSRPELESLATFCLENKIVICSDEIHCDLILEKLDHVPFATLTPELESQTITLMAPSKTFNIPGLGCAFAIIPNPLIKGKFKAAMEGIVPDVNALGYTACLAAYRDCNHWVKELIRYLRGNRDLLMRRIKGEMSALSINPIEATYLAWIDVRQTGISQPGAYFENYGVGLSDGAYFGTNGFIRLNYGCPRSLLCEGLNRMKTALTEFCETNLSNGNKG